jgi:phosphoribosyl 1,2-cyclic phosphodiesterase
LPRSGADRLELDESAGKWISSPVMKHEVSLIPLGTGAGSTAVLHGQPSSGFAIQVGDQYPLLVDLGMGIARQALKQCGEIPENVFISHNHSDHSGDLPVVAMKFFQAGRKLRIFSAPEVAERLRRHRLHEFQEAGYSPEDLAQWVETPEGLETGIAADLSLVPYRGLHSETSFGFVLLYQGSPILGYSADSAYYPDLYRRLAQAPVLILDGRKNSTRDHASLEEILRFEPTVTSRIYVIHYGTAEEAPMRPTPLRLGESLRLT